MTQNTKSGSAKHQLEPGWQQRLKGEFQKPYMQTLRTFLAQRKRSGAVIYPEAAHYFSAFDATPFDDVKVVMLGQDPYHGPQQAHGLCFSVLPEVKIPPSLRNIYKEINTDLGIPAPDHGYLMPWAKQGVFMLNSVLTVEQGEAGAHQKQGWELFTDQAIAALATERENLVFLLWGAYAQKKGQFIDRNKHLVLESVHPSPLSASRGFIGCRHFSLTNAYLEKQNVVPIDWSIPPKALLSLSSEKNPKEGVATR